MLEFAQEYFVGGDWTPFAHLEEEEEEEVVVD